MRKILSLGLFLASATVFAQPYTETFDNSNISGSYSDGSFVGVQSIDYTYVHSRNEGNYPIDGEGVMLRRNDEPSSLEVTYPNGLSQFSFEYRKAFAGGSDRQLDILVNGAVVDSTPIFGSGSGEQTTVYTYTMPTSEIQNINSDSPVTIKIVISANLSGGNRQAVIDNIVWAPYDPTASINNNAIDGLRVYPNPAKDIVTIATDAGASKKVQIFDIVGKKVMENTIQNILNISGLNKGVYILKIEENGKIATKKLVVE